MFNDNKKSENKDFKIFSLKDNKKWLITSVLASIFLLLFFIFGLLFVLFEISYDQKFFPGSKIGPINLSGLNQDQAFDVIESISNDLVSDVIKINLNNNNENKIILINQNTNADAARSLFDYDIYRTIYDNYQVGRKTNSFSGWWQQLLLVVGVKKMKAVYNIDKDFIKTQILSELKNLEIKEINATPNFICLDDGCQIEIIPEKEGFSFNYDEAINEWLVGISEFKNNPIEIKQIIIQPQITTKDVEEFKESFFNLDLNSFVPEYYSQNKTFKLDFKKINNLIVFQKNENEIVLGLNKDVFSIWFEKNISKNIDVEAQNATLQMINGKISNLSAHKNGKKADLDKAFNDLNQQINNKNFENHRFELQINDIAPEVVTGDVNNLGIKEILGTGQSNFAGSPTNRRKNIKNGATKLNGLLIKPGDEFSLIKALLPIDAKNGYVTELVIKDNKTIPEFGGGLCQVGTTMFRSALASGLPILERRNHSYSVTYYLENGLPGVDATIYDPKPDFRFKNDTENYILIQSRIEGDNLYFDFWGTKDGRVAERTKPKTWGLKAPPPTKYIETTTLAPGTKKCTENSHNGISASFNYIVSYSDGNIVTSTFTSVYKPWQAVCLVGIEKVVTPSTTPEVLTEE